MKYSKLRTKDGHIISSKWTSKKDKTNSRNNYSVLVCTVHSMIISYILLQGYINLALY